MTESRTIPPERLWSPDTRPFIASVLALMTFIAFESFAVTTVLPVAMSDLDGAQWYSFAYAATITAALVGMVIGGNWADRSGPRTPLIVGGALFLAGLAMCVVAPDPATFILGRLFQGLGGGIDSVVLYVLIAQHIPENLRPRMFGLLTTAWLVPSLAGPVVAGVLTDFMSWRAVFGIVLAGSALSILRLLSLTAPNDHPRRLTSQPVVGRKGALSIVAAALLITLHAGGQVNQPASAVIVVGALIALIVVARGILPTGTLVLRGAPQRLVALRAILGATVTSTDLYLTLYLQAERGFPPTTAGLVIAVGALGWGLGAWVQGRFSSERSAHRRLILAAGPLVTFGPASVLSYIVVGLPLWVVVVGCVVMGTGMGMAYPRLSSATLALAKAHERGEYSSALQTGESMSVAATTAMTAVVLTSALSTSVSFALVYAILVGLACLAISIASLRTTAHS
ncbi:MFS transporter [Dietzia sp. B19]|uniref:MFS transporter n=1 Tax=Dietzia sp. B19 TaxID=1630632 RepID=UPI0019D5C03E